jgi:signal-transduction protein with cAMP-binding, CBS, and nucleotidyltransferase domain
MRTGIKVGDCMKTTLVAIGAGASIYEAAELMKRERVGSLLVEDGNGDLSSIVTDTDIVDKCVATRNMDVTVGSIANSPLVAIDFEADLSEAATLMGKKGVKRIVVTKDGRPAGMVSMTDIISLSPSSYELVAGKVRGSH